MVPHSLRLNSMHINDLRATYFFMQITTRFYWQRFLGVQNIGHPRKVAAGLAMKRRYSARDLRLDFARFLITRSFARVRERG